MQHTHTIPLLSLSLSLSLSLAFSSAPRWRVGSGRDAGFHGRKHDLLARAESAQEAAHTARRSVLAFAFGKQEPEAPSRRLAGAFGKQEPGQNARRSVLVQCFLDTVAPRGGPSRRPRYQASAVRTMGAMVV
jgi:hypothetical protein